MTALRNLSFLAVLSLAACGSPPANTIADDVDPAVTSALADPIMTDPQLDGLSDTDSLRPAPQPIQALAPPGEPDPLRGDAPPTLAARGRRLIADHDANSFANCSRAVSYTFGWSNRLPEGLTLPADARVSEAAGSDSSNCSLRLVAFAAASTPSSVVEIYRRAATSGGFTVTETRAGDTTIVRARRAADGSAFIASVGDTTAGGSNVDLLTNRGR
jgi:hypothetical protein